MIATKLSVGVQRYRAEVLHVHRHEEVDVRFFNYGNKEHVFGKEVRQPSNAEGLSAPPIATQVTLDSVVIPNKSNLNCVNAEE